MSADLEGERSALESFLLRLEKEAPPLARIFSIEPRFLVPIGHERLEIEASDETGPVQAVVLPDIATCEECRREIFDPDDRRYLYPFNNCTHCGPRYSIIESLPYDRSRTTMKSFRMCPRCREEYEDPSNRRFHAQPVACPVCGPWVELWSGDRRRIAAREEALERLVEYILEGRIAMELEYLHGC